MKKASKRRILFAARMATMVGAACFAVSGISETLGQEKEKSRPVYIATEEVTETTYMPEVEETTQPTETAKAVETEEPLIASMDWDKDDSYLLCKIAMAEAESEGVKGKALVMLVVLNRVWSDEFPDINSTRKMWICILRARATVSGIARIWNFFSSTANITSISERNRRYEKI